MCPAMLMFAQHSPFLLLRRLLPQAPPAHIAHARLAATFETTFILESREGPERLARYSFVGFAPAGLVTLDKSGLQVQGALPAPSRDQNPLEYLRRIQAFYHTEDQESPFVGGLVGSLGHDFVRFLEPSLESEKPESWPRALFGLYLDGLVYDHHDGTCTYVSRGEDRLEALQAALDSNPPDAQFHVDGLIASVDQPTFEAAVLDVQQQIRAGEAFQIVLSRAYTANHTGPLTRLYDWLRDAAAVPYLYHLRFGDRELVGASPEMLVRVRQGKVETFPIAGTRPVTGDEATDAAAGADLVKDRKETAEHAMLVDLARNDLSRVCAPGTVRVKAFQEVHRFRSVQHMVSHVVGHLQPQKDALDALAAVFPAGTVSGAPKVRALEHIDRLETTPRGPYAGCVAYLSFNGDFDSAIAIRSLSREGPTLTVQAGAGIVHRSDPTSEFMETRHKASTLLDGLATFGAILPQELVAKVNP